MRLFVKASQGLVLLCKKPEFFCRSVEGGEELEVSDELGHALLALYPQHLAVCEAPKAEAKARTPKLKG